MFGSVWVGISLRRVHGGLFFVLFIYYVDIVIYIYTLVLAVFGLYICGIVSASDTLTEYAFYRMIIHYFAFFPPLSPFFCTCYFKSYLGAEASDFSCREAHFSVFI